MLDTIGQAIAADPWAAFGLVVGIIFAIGFITQR